MLSINYRDSKPIYEQIMVGVRKLVISGAMQENEKLPSVRELATNMAINPNTIQRAYRELEAEGYIYSIVGRGSFVARYDTQNERRRNELLRRFDEICEELIYIGTKQDILKDRLDKVINKVEMEVLSRQSDGKQASSEELQEQNEQGRDLREVKDDRG